MEDDGNMNRTEKKNELWKKLFQIKLCNFLDKKRNNTFLLTYRTFYT